MIFNKIFTIVLLLKINFIFAEEKTKKPNVLVILVDDVGTGDIPGYHNDSCKVTSMVNIEELVSKGVLFTDAHATPLCAPSRYSFLSGNYQQKGRKMNGSWSFKTGSQFITGQQSIADVFSSAGYNTAMVGKWHIGGTIRPNGIQSERWILTSKKHDWTLPFEGGPQDIGFTSSYITAAGIQYPPYSFFRNGILETARKDIRHWNKGWYKTSSGNKSRVQKQGQGDKNWDSAAYNMILVNETNRFLDQHKKHRPDDPFFAYVATGR